MKTPRFGFLAWTCTVLVIGLLSLSTGRAQNVIAWGDDSYGQADVPASATNVIAVAAGDRHSLGLRSDGTVVCWGSGAGTNIPPDVTNAVAIAAGQWHSAALLADHSVVAWGDNYSSKPMFRRRLPMLSPSPPVIITLSPCERTAR